MPRGKTTKVLDFIDACKTILTAIEPCTVRAVAYQLFIHHWIPSMEKKHTNKVSEHLKYAREQGIIPWAWIVDETREAEHPGTWANPESFIPAVMRSYRRDRWALQSRRVEIWSEKGTVRGTLAPILRDFGLTLRVAHGYTSATAVNEVAQESLESPCPLTVLYVGDYDPSGLHMSAVDLPARLARYGGGAIDLHRLGILATDLAALPGFPAAEKQKDTRYAWFVRHHGPDCCELDAMNPVELRTRVETAVRALIDWPRWEQCARVERAEQQSLRAILGTWPRAIAGQARL